MCCKQRGKMSEYQLRQAAGSYFLLHMEQKGVPYERPLKLNQAGAEMWKLLKEGKTTEQIAENLAQKYGVAADEIIEDIKQFYQQLASLDIFGEG